MAEIEDFDDAEIGTFEDFEDVDESKFITNEFSTANFAATAVLASDGADVSGVFQGVTSEIVEKGSSEIARGIEESLAVTNDEANKQAVLEQIVNPNIPELEKINLVDGFFEQRSNPLNTRIVLGQSLLLDTLQFDTQESTEIRERAANNYRAVNDQINFLQEQFNVVASETDVGVFDTLVNIAQISIPFVEAAKFSAFAKAVTDNEAPKALILLGQAKREFADKFQTLDPAEQRQIAKSFAEGLSSHPGLVAKDGNELTRLMNFSLLIDGSFSKSDEVIDNIFSVIDFLTVGALTPITRPLKAALTASRVPELARRIARMSRVRSTAQPGSVANMLRATNPEKARALHEAVAVDATDSMARTAYGSTRVDALADDLLPVIGNEIDSVPAKVSRMDSLFEEAENAKLGVFRFFRRGGDIHFFDAEKAELQAMVTHKFREATGLIAKPNMFQIKSVGKETKVISKAPVGEEAIDSGITVTRAEGGVNVRGVYGPDNGGFSTAVEARTAIEFGLKDFGIPAKDITVLRNVDGEYIPVTKSLGTIDITNKRLADFDTASSQFRVETKVVDGKTKVFATDLVDEAGDFLVAIDYKYEWNPADVIKWARTSTKGNIFDQFPSLNASIRQGTMQRMLTTVQSFLDPVVTRGASVAIERSTGLLDALANQANVYVKQFRGLNKRDKSSVEKLIRFANVEGVELTPTIMRAAGLGDNQIQALNSWRSIWDTHYILENRFHSKSLSSKNFGFFVDKANDSTYLARPVAQVPKGERFFDPKSGEVVDLTTEQLQLIKDGKAKVAELRSPIHVGDGDELETASLIFSRETADEGFIRKLNLDDQVLPYRQGYYQIGYKDPQFVVKRTVDKNGKISDQAIATSRTTKSAKSMIDRMTSLEKNPNVTFFQRGDLKGQRGSDETFEVAFSQGRTAQRTRGQRLQDTTSPNTDPLHENILDPVEALVRSVNSLGKRASIIDYVEATTARAIDQFKNVFPKDKFGRPRYPSNLNEIASPSGKFGKEAGDARSSYEYIESIQNGYVNSLDDGVKAILNGLADVSGALDIKLGAKTDIAGVGEILLREGAEKIRPFQGAKSLASFMLLGLSPLRQRFIQSHQSIRLLGLWPGWALTKMVPQTQTLHLGLRGMRPPDIALKGAGLTRQEYDTLFDEFTKSGLHLAGTSNNLLRSDLTSLVRTSPIGRTFDAARDFLGFFKKVGFGAGEQFNITTAYVGAFSEAVRKKGFKNLTSEDWEDITAKTRDITGNFNLAGDLPYTQNAASLFMQFMQTPHKIFFQYFNRNLSKSERVRLATTDMLLWGIPRGTIAFFLGDKFIADNPEVSEILENGLEGPIINSVMTGITGDIVETDFEGLAAANRGGIARIFETVLTKPIGESLSNTPAGQFFGGNNAKIATGIKAVINLFNPDESQVDPQTFAETSMAIAKNSSGFSALTRAMMAWRTGQRMDALETRVLDDNVNTTEAIFMAFGFPTKTEAYNRIVSQEVWEKTRDFNESLDTAWKELMLRMSNQSLSVDDLKRISVPTARMFQLFGNTALVQTFIAKKLRQQGRDGDDAFIRALFKLADMGPDEGEIESLVVRSGMSAEDKGRVQKVFRDIEAAQKGLE